MMNYERKTQIDNRKIVKKWNQKQWQIWNEFVIFIKEKTGKKYKNKIK